MNTKIIIITALIFFSSSVFATLPAGITTIDSITMYEGGGVI